MRKSILVALVSIAATLTGVEASQALRPHLKLSNWMQSSEGIQYLNSASDWTPITLWKSPDAVMQGQGWGHNHPTVIDIPYADGDKYDCGIVCFVNNKGERSECFSLMEIGER